MSTTTIQIINQSSKGDPLNICLAEWLEFHSENVKLVPWKIIKHLSTDFTHGFKYTHQVCLLVKDEFGNHSKTWSLKKGVRYELKKVTNQIRLLAIGKSWNGQIEIKNAIKASAYKVCLLRGSEVFATVDCLVPGDYFFLACSEKLVARVIQLPFHESQLNDIISDDFSTILDVGGPKDVDVFLVGGGWGSTATPYEFYLTNN